MGELDRKALESCGIEVGDDRVNCRDRCQNQHERHRGLQARHSPTTSRVRSLPVPPLTSTVRPAPVDPPCPYLRRYGAHPPGMEEQLEALEARLAEELRAGVDFTCRPE